jgi:hypothetical protein
MALLTNVKGFHTTPGIYQKETEMRATRESVGGITSLGLVGETLQGPAFTPIFIDNWRNFVNVFGGTSTEQYSGSKYPRYELPYIAQDYLPESQQLYVTRVLGLSGYNAGKAWLIKAIGSGEGQNMLVAVIRSRGHYVETFGLPKYSDEEVPSGRIEKNVQYVVGRKDQTNDEAIPQNSFIRYNNVQYGLGQRFFGTDITIYDANAGLTVYGYCGTSYEYDKFVWDVDEVYISTAGETAANFTCGLAGTFENTDSYGVPCTPTNFGTFKLVCKLKGIVPRYISYTVSLNPGSSDYIYNVLGGTAQGTTPIYVEELYDVALQNLVLKKATDPVNYIEGILIGKPISDQPTIVPEVLYDGLTEQGQEDTIIPKFRPVNGILRMPNHTLDVNNLGERYLYSKDESPVTEYFNGEDVSSSQITDPLRDNGKILVVRRTLNEGGSMSYNYHWLGEQLSIKKVDELTGESERFVFVVEENLFYEIVDLSGGKTGPDPLLRVEADLTPGVVMRMDVTERGSGYTDDIRITINEPEYDGDTKRTAVVGDVVLDDDGAIISVSIRDGGSGYTLPPTVTIEGTGTGATLIPRVGSSIKQIRVVNPGNGGYISKPHVLVRVGQSIDDVFNDYEEFDGVHAIAEAVIRNGVLIGINLINPGSGYSRENDVIIVTIGGEGSIIQRVIGNISDYLEPYRTPVTPWVVSQMMGNFSVNEVKKLFRFFTISDGTNANTRYKISIQNVNPSSLTFDVVVRDFYDNDGSAKPLEIFKGCNLNPASSGYILNRIGDVNGSTIQRSSFIMVEVADNDTIKYAIPCGFLGYPIRYLGSNVQKPLLSYNTQVYESIRAKRQYFGVSDLTGIDTDIFSYKGRSAYTDGYYTDGFHLDSRISNCNTIVDGENPNVDCTGTNRDLYTNGVFTWQTPPLEMRGEEGEPPMISTPEDVLGTIYEDITMRKFTLCFYGGFDGWDPYRTIRTTADNFKRNKYKGRISGASGNGSRFSVLHDDYGIPAGGITSDYYAFWAGFETMANPFATPINVLATPGIDYVNNTLLFKEALDVVERDYNQKTIYFVTTPDKPIGANDNPANMYSALDVVGNLEVAEIDSSYTATFYPWCQYYDMNENKAIFLPPTKDIIKLLTQIDNTSYSWYPAAGINNGQIDCIGPRKILKMEETDTLTGSRINPVVKFSKQGVYSWGQKTLKVSYDGDREPLTRIGVRRMMIRIKELVEHANRGLLFTPNDMTTANKFKSNTSTILNDVRTNRGISDYRIEVDNSVEARENRTLPAKVWIKPLSMLEFIEIEWVITPQGMEMV